MEALNKIRSKDQFKNIKERIDRAESQAKHTMKQMNKRLGKKKSAQRMDPELYHKVDISPQIVQIVVQTDPFEELN
jgi:di/tripeptidase